MRKVTYPRLPTKRTRKNEQMIVSTDAHRRFRPNGSACVVFGNEREVVFGNEGKTDVRRAFGGMREMFCATSEKNGRRRF